jgi:hypothetical protein
MSEDLLSIVPKYIVSWRRMSRVYAGFSIVLRGTLIIASAIVAAKLGHLLPDTAVLVLSIYVAAGTGLEAWLKPREKWKGFMTDGEKAEDLLMRLRNIPGPDAKQADEFRLEFQRILENHREKNVF